MLQYLIVGLIVGAALAYSVWVILPATLRGAAAARMARWAMRSGVDESKARRLQTQLAKAGACSECSQCKGCAIGSRQEPGSTI
jgi:hypothetical protein